MSVSMATGQFLFVELDGDSLEIDDAIKVSKRECCVKVTCINASSNIHAAACILLHHYMFLCIQLSEDAKKKVKASRKIVDDVVKDGTGMLIAR